MNVRDSDIEDGHSKIKISRDIPLPWLIGFSIAAVAQLAQSYYGQQRQGELILELTAQVRQLVSDNGTKNIKDAERDLYISDLTRRVLTLESLRNK